MPYGVRKRKCRQANNKPGNYAVVKEKTSSEEQVSCHVDKKDAKGSIRARYANEVTIRISNVALRKLIRESLYEHASMRTKEI